MALRQVQAAKRRIENYSHPDKTRPNNPPVGLVAPETDKDAGHTRYRYDPHLDPQLVWAGKAERTSFEVPTVSLHVHERIDPRTIIEAVKRRNGNEPQLSLFEAERKAPLRQEIEFYRHKHDWSNRLIAGDSLLVMNSLLGKEGMGGQVQMVYIDPPYGITYRSNFQPFTNKRDVADGDKDDDLTAEPETLKAFRDTWELDIHSYVSYMRDRLLLIRDLLHESGPCFIQISEENIHLVRSIMDEIFGADCFVVTFPVKKNGSQKSDLIDPVNDYIVWYAKSPRESGQIKFRPLYEKRELDADTLDEFRFVELPDGGEYLISAVPGPDGEAIDYRLRPKRLFKDHPQARLFRPNPLKSGGHYRTQSVPFEYEGKLYEPGPNRCWKASAITDDGSPSGMQRLAWAGRIIAQEGDLRFRSYLDDFGYVAQTQH